MRIGRPAKTGRLRRLARRLWIGRSPLRRRTDRFEAWVTAGLLGAFLAGAPLCCVAAGRWVQQGGALEQRAQQSWQQVPAVLVRAAPMLPSYYARANWNVKVLALARWAAPGGRERAGDVPVPPGSLAGRRVQIWVDGSGRLTAAPLLHAQLVRRVIGAEALAPLGLAVVLLAAGGLVRWLMDRRRLAAWEAGWASIGPRWTRHR